MYNKVSGVFKIVAGWREHQPRRTALAGVPPAKTI
jgi:hypothetical protein